MSQSPTKTDFPHRTASEEGLENEAGSSETALGEKEIKEELVPADMCAICWASNMKDRTEMDKCNHVFCLICIKHWIWQAQACPLCREVPTEICSNVGQPNEKRYTIDELMKEKEEYDRHMVGNAFPMTNEKEILIKRKHELSRLINDNLATELKTRCRREGMFKRKDTILRSNREHQEAVTERNGIQMLLDGIEDKSLDRQNLISHPIFRNLVYLYDCEWYLVDPTLNSHMRRFTRQLARQYEGAQRDRVKAFIARELAVIPVVPAMKHNMSGPAYRMKCANYIFDECLNHQIHSPGFSRILVGTSVGMMRHAVERFQHELFEFASSQLDMVEFCKISGYRLPEGTLRHSPNDNNFAVGGLNDLGPPDVITLNDTTVDDEIVISDDEPVVVGSVQGERNNARNESNFVRDEPVSSGSDRDEIFHRPACRLMQHAPIGMNWIGLNRVVNPYMGPPISFEDIFNGTGMLAQFGSHNPRPAPRYEQYFGPSTSGLRSRVDNADAHVIDAGASTSRSNSHSSPATPVSARSPGCSMASSDGDASNSRSRGSAYDTAGGSGENSNSPRAIRLSRRLRRQSEERERSTSRASCDKYRSKLEKYHRNLKSSRDRQNSIDWLKREVTKLETSDGDRNGNPMDRNEDRDCPRTFTRSRSRRYNRDR